MPGVLIEDMPFSLDSVSSGSSPFFESSAGFYTHHHHQLSSVTSAGEQTSPSAPAIINSTTTATATNNNGNSGHSINNNNNYFKCSHTDYLHQQQHPPSLLETLLAVSSPQSSPSSSSMESLSPRGAPHDAVASALHRFLPSNNDESSWSAEDVYSCDEFRMFEFKVRRCMRGRSHDWTECPFAHPGEKARRRDPRRFHYSGTACPDFRKGNCKNGDACELAHGVFECWLHPARYRTQPCKDGRSCKRRVCFFAHTAEQLRLLSTSSGSSTTTCSPSSVSMSACAAASDSSSSPCSSPRRSANPTLFRSLSESNKSFEPIDSSSPSSASHCCCSHSQYRAACCGGSSAPTRLTTSPTSTLVGLGQSPPPLSPPLSPTHSPPMSPSSCVPRRHIDTRRLFSAPSSPCTAVHHQAPGTKTMCELVTALQQLELQKSLQHNPSWIQCSQPSYSPSPLRPTLNTSGIPCSMQQRGVSLSLPATPTKPRWETMWEMDLGEEEMVIDGEMMAASLVSPRVESGRDLRAKIYGRLAGRGGEALPTFGTSASVGEPSPDLNWVNDLVMD